MHYYFDEIDDCIKAAYDHVKITNYKVVNFSTTWVIGFQSSNDDLFIMIRPRYQYSTKRNIIDELTRQNVTAVDFINKQLMVFL